MYDYTDPARDEYLSTGCDLRGLMPSPGKSFRKCGAGKRQIE